jgi:ribose transport system substrate-binding protein
MKHFSGVGFFVALALALAGCGSGSQDTSTESASGASGGSTKPTYKIAVIPKGSTHEFWKSVHAGADDAAKELGNVEVIWKGPTKEDDRDDQIKVVELFTAQGVDGIVLAPLDDTALKQPVEDAKNSDIPVLIIDSALKGTDVVSFVATDNKNGGSMAADALAKALGEKGDVAILRYQEGSASTGDREEGFLEQMRKYPDVHVISLNQYAGATVETAQTASENLLQRYRNGDGTLGLAGIYTPNESSTFGMLRALQDNGWAGKVKFVGFDASKKLIDGLDAGQIDALVVQDPHKMGYLGVKTLVDSLNGKTPEKRIDTGAVLVTKEKRNDPDIEALLKPML